MNIIITQQKEIVGEDNNKYSCWEDIKYTVTIPDFKNHYFSYKQKKLKHCLKVVRCYINTKQKCHLYLSVSSCFTLLKSFQLTRQICYNKEKTEHFNRVWSGIGKNDKSQLNMSQQAKQTPMFQDKNRVKNFEFFDFLTFKSFTTTVLNLRALTILTNCCTIIHDSSQNIQKNKF
ncbi:Hypothetical_protein [Hexamita inflata]|uniref:Hypothetical_protein n=1 Tax=Hexamita inflata TaxID=28002 RepID=A0AA86VSN9_9EUKA|nr:Hypothetical protein HINF_LOCUS63918 [Hexamita inflata]